MTNKQEEVFVTVVTYQALNFNMPSIRTICKLVNVNSSATAYTYINELVKKGYFKKNNKGILIYTDLGLKLAKKYLRDLKNEKK